ncbi:restriction endonuclease subunit S [uncultured Methanobrevibacter sp.]|uniref:restriction endonuclease subunit S n=1 Tax=uncultured Methanobrevibacter sp. TaxID=253161 RepID=UPI0025F86812|nr:restriction endonuclease subunit S [uncultured Methanobrevibacter sp.]
MSLDKANNDDWNWIKAKDFMIFNPRESVKKGTSIKNIPMDKIEPKTKEISSYEITEFKGGVKFRNGDTLMARITPCLENGKISQVSILDYNEIGAGSTEFIVLREKEGVSDKDFIYYLSNSEFFKEPAIKSMVGSSGRQRVQRDVVENLEIYVPPLDTQKKIGKLLSYFDDKISLNKKINKNLEALAKSIYRYHFIDFEPYSQDNFKSTTIGEIPENWEVQSIGDFVDDMKNGGTPKRGESDYWDDGTVPWLKTGEINNNMIIKSEEYITELGLKNSSAKLLPINSIIMALYGKGTAARVGLLKLKATTNQACCAMICNDFNKTLFLYLFLLFNQKEIENLASGSVQQNLSKDLIANLELVVPPIEIIENLPFKEIYDKIANNYFEIEYLTNLRDTLLPKLMSGEIDVSKINCDFENIAHFMILSFKKIIGYLGLYFIRFL